VALRFEAALLEVAMLSWALTFLVIALIAGFFGFGGVAVVAADFARILFFLFLVLFVVTLASDLFRRRRRL
jgi:uncharacterized membrane protein YtjA (UPF0391 family)